MWGPSKDRNAPMTASSWGVKCMPAQESRPPPSNSLPCLLMSCTTAITLFLWRGSVVVLISRTREQGGGVKVCFRPFGYVRSVDVAQAVTMLRTLMLEGRSNELHSCICTYQVWYSLSPTLHRSHPVYPYSRVSFAASDGHGEDRMCLETRLQVHLFVETRIGVHV